MVQSHAKRGRKYNPSEGDVSAKRELARRATRESVYVPRTSLVCM
jgi:hypothetical protein